MAMVAAATATSERGHATELSFSKGTVLITGKIRQEDPTKLKTFINEVGPQAITTVQLNSGGGDIGSALEMARLIRKNGYTTLVDAQSGRCFSACTVLFIAGTRRAYVNATMVRDGLKTAPDKSLGLGFHGAWNLHMGNRSSTPSGTSMMIAGYYEFGVPAAKDLPTKAEFNQMYLISPETALSMGIATEVSSPPPAKRRASRTE